MGKGTFVDDIELPRMLHLGIVRSKYAHARIRDVSGGINYREINPKLAWFGKGVKIKERWLIQPTFASKYAQYFGQPVAAVYSDDIYKLDDLLESVNVEYEPIKPVLSVDEAALSPPIHQKSTSNVYYDKIFGKPFSKQNAPVVVEGSFSIGRITPNPLETRGLVVDYDGKTLNVIVSTRSVSSIKMGLCLALGLKPQNVRVIQADTGGAFGLKDDVYPEDVIASYIAIKERRPVKWIETRSEHLIASSPGRGSAATLKLYSKKDGTIVGLSGTIKVDTGAFINGYGAFSSHEIGTMITGPYRIKNVHIRSLSFFTNKVPNGAYRGTGMPDAAFYIERMMDLLADKLKMDPIILRMRNTVNGRFTSPTGLTICDSKKFLKMGLAKVGYKAGKKNAGFSLFVLHPALSLGESIKVVLKDNNIYVWTGSNPHGQHTAKIISKIFAEELGIDSKHVILNRPDTDVLTTDAGTGGSRSAMLVSEAVYKAAQRIKDKIAHNYGKYHYNLLNKVNDTFVIHVAHKNEINPLGCNYIEVGNDEYGNIKVKRCTAFYDVGKIIVKKDIFGQITGGTLQGIGQVLSEEMKLDKDGRPVSKSIIDSGVLDITNTPEFDIKLLEDPAPIPYGAKGVGESAAIGVPPALTQAIEKLIDQKINATPISSEFIFRSIYGDSNDCK